MPVDDGVIQNTNLAQMNWYATQLNLEEEADFQEKLDLTEHNAMFFNPEGVQQVREERENSYDTNDEEFEDMVRNQFGREIPEVREEDLIGPGDLLSQEGGLDLDDVKFTPLK